MKEVEEFVGPPRREFKECKAPERYSSYMAMVTSLHESEPSTFEEEDTHQVWRDATMEEYNSIMKNDVWEIVLRLENTSVVTSKWIFKVNHTIDGRIMSNRCKSLLIVNFLNM